MGGAAIVEALAALESQGLTATPQDDSEATYAHKLSKDEARIQWPDDAATIARKVRAFNPWPGTDGELEIDVTNIQIEPGLGDKAGVQCQ